MTEQSTKIMSGGESIESAADAMTEVERTWSMKVTRLFKDLMSKIGQWYEAPLKSVGASDKRARQVAWVCALLNFSPIPGSATLPYLIAMGAFKTGKTREMLKELKKTDFDEVAELARFLLETADKSDEEKN